MEKQSGIAYIPYHPLGVAAHITHVSGNPIFYGNSEYRQTDEIHFGDTMTSIKIQNVNGDTGWINNVSGTNVWTCWIS